jgi:hypothetical protein
MATGTEVLMTAIDRLRTIEFEEVAIFRKHHFDTTEVLWEKLREDQKDVTKKLADEGVSHDRIYTLFAAAAESRSWRYRAEQHVPDAILVVVALALIALLVRGLGGASRLPSPWGLSERVTIAVRDLPANHVLEPEDMERALLPRGTTSFTSTNQLTGLVTAHSVSRLQPLRFADVLQLQVVATTDIPRGAMVAAGEVALRWSPFSPIAERELSPVVKHTTRRALLAGSVVTSDTIGP